MKTRNRIVVWAVALLALAAGSTAVACHFLNHSSAVTAFPPGD